MEKVTIIGGQFAKGDGKKGNFVAELNNGEEIFVLKNRMSAIGIDETTLKDVKWPLYGLLGEREFNKRNPDYNPEDKDSKEFLVDTTKRKEIKRVFRTAQELAQVTTSGELIAIEEKKAIIEIRKANKLTDEDLLILQNADY